VSRAEHTAVEAAVMASQIEQLPDLHGYLKLASSPEWRRVALPLPDRARGSLAGGEAAVRAVAHKARAAARDSQRVHEGFGA
jgi:hypothetical protein